MRYHQIQNSASKENNIRTTASTLFTHFDTTAPLDRKHFCQRMSGGILTLAEICNVRLLCLLFFLIL